MGRQAARAHVVGIADPDARLLGRDKREEHRHDGDDRHRQQAAQRDDLIVFDAAGTGCGVTLRRRRRGRKTHARAFTDR